MPLSEDQSLSYFFDNNELSSRAYNVCVRNGLTQLRQLLEFYKNHGDFLALNGCGRRTRDELRDLVEHYSRYDFEPDALSKEVVSNRDFVHQKMKYFDDNQRALAQNAFSQVFSQLPERARKVLINAQYDYSNFLNVAKAPRNMKYRLLATGKHSYQQILAGVNKYYELIISIIRSDAERVDTLRISNVYNFLDKQDQSYILYFSKAHGYDPLFFIIKKFLESSVTDSQRLYLAYHGICCDRDNALYLRYEIDSLSALHARIEGEKTLRSHPVFNMQSLMSKYPFLKYDFIIANRELEQINSTELPEGEVLDVNSFAYIIDLMLNNYRYVYNDKILLFSNRFISSFDVTAALKEIELVDKSQDGDVPRIHVPALVAKHARAKSVISQEDLVKYFEDILRTVFPSVHLLHAVVVRKPRAERKVDYTNLIPKIIETNKAPMHISKIVEEFHKLAPDKSTIQIAGLRVYVANSQEVELVDSALGLYALKKWHIHPKQPREILIDVLRESSRPLSSRELFEALRMRGDKITKKAFEKLLAEDKAFVKFSDDLYGLRDREYDRDKIENSSIVKSTKNKPSKRGRKKSVAQPVAEEVETQVKKRGRKKAVAQSVAEEIETHVKKRGRKKSVAQPVAEEVATQVKKRGRKKSVAQPVAEEVVVQVKKRGRKKSVAQPVTEEIEKKSKRGRKKSAKRSVANYDMEAFLTFVEANHRLPLAVSRSKSETNLYRWYQKALSSELEITKKQSERFLNALRPNVQISEPVKKSAKTSNVEYDIKIEIDRPCAETTKVEKVKKVAKVEESAKAPKAVKPQKVDRVEKFEKECEAYRAYVKERSELPDYSTSKSLSLWFDKNVRLTYDDKRSELSADLLDFLSYYDDTFINYRKKK